MNRHALRDRRLPRDSTVKTAPRRREKMKRLVSSKHECPTLPEEPEENMNETTVKPVGQVRVSAVPVRCRSVSRLSGPATSEQTRSQASPSVTPANKKPVSQSAYLTLEVMPTLKTFKDSGTPDSVISCSMDTDLTLNSKEDDDEDDDNPCFSSSSTLSSLPSPEIFRKESGVETIDFPKKNELLRVNLPIKNSTLLESSRAENIHLHHPPDLSAIIGEAAMNLAKKNCESSHQKIPENRSKIQTDSDCSLKRKTPPKLTKRKLILCKKKVWFKSPITEMFKPEHSPPSSATRSTSESPGQMTLAPEASRMVEISSKSKTLPLLGTLNQPVTRSSAMFFDFGSDNERDAFFQRMRKRSAELRSFVVFPSRLDTQTPPHLLTASSSSH